MNATEFGLARKVAVVTGASSGIGKVFAERLAEDGYDVLLAARRSALLDRLAEQLRERSGVNVQVAQVDLANADQLDQFVMRLQALPAVACLVNNAGFGYIGDFADLPLEKHLRMLDVHVTATVRLTYAVLPRMVEAGEGTLINVASLAAWTVGPGQAIYNSTKAFVKSFTEALHAEVEGTKIRVQALCPGITRTGFHDTEEFVGFDRSQMPNLWMSADEVVDESMAALRRNRPVCVPGFKNRVLAFLFGFNPIRRFAGKSVRKRPAMK